MSYSIWGSIAETPWWIYLIVLWALNVSYRCTKPSRVTLNSSLLSPVIVTSMMLFSMCLVIHFDFHKYLLFILAIFPGMILSWLQFRLRRIKAVRNKHQFYIPGSWNVFIIMFTLFAAKLYFYGFSFTLDPDTLKQNAETIIVLCGFITGLMLARVCCFYRCMKTTCRPPSTWRNRSRRTST